MSVSTVSGSARGGGATGTASPVVFDIYTGGGLKKKEDLDINRPPEPGEYARRVSTLSGDRRAILQQAVVIFKELDKTLADARRDLSETKEMAKAANNVEIETAAKKILVALRKDDVGPALVESIKQQYYVGLIYADRYDKALNLYPALKIAIGARLTGIYSLIERVKIFSFGEGILYRYFKTTPNSREGLHRILLKPGVTTSGILNPDDQEALYHFGSRLPLYYLITSDLQLPEGVCGNGDDTTEDRIRHIFGTSMASIPRGLFDRLCGFAAAYA